MAYYLKPQDDEEQQQGQTIGQKEGGQYTVPQAPSPQQQINKSNMEGGTVQPVGSSSAAPAAMAPATAPAQGPTRSKGGFVNLQRYLEANKDWNPEEQVQKISDKLGGEIDKSYQDATAGTKAFIANGGTPQFQQQFGQQTVGKDGKIVVSQDPYPDFKNLLMAASAGNKEAQARLKQIMTKDDIPQGTSWSLTPEMQAKIAGLASPNTVGKNSLISQIAGDPSNYSAGMEGLDRSLLQVKPGAIEKFKNISETLGNKVKGFNEEQDKTNKELGLMRLRDEQLADYANTSLGDWYKQLTGAPTREGEVPNPYQFEYSEQGIPSWAKYLAQILGQNPDLYQMKAKPPETVTGDDSGDAAWQKKMAKIPGARKKIGQIEDSVRQANRRS